jgi:hypothetical protein
MAIVETCSFLPLVIEWFVGRAGMKRGRSVRGRPARSSKTGEELLEFCFRRVNDQLSPAAKRALKVLSSSKPEPIDALLRDPTPGGDGR